MCQWQEVQSKALKPSKLNKKYLAMWSSLHNLMLLVAQDTGTRAGARRPNAPSSTTRTPSTAGCSSGAPWPPALPPSPLPPLPPPPRSTHETRAATTLATTALRTPSPTPSRTWLQVRRPGRGSKCRRRRRRWTRARNRAPEQLIWSNRPLRRVAWARRSPCGATRSAPGAHDL